MAATPVNQESGGLKELADALLPITNKQSNGNRRKSTSPQSPRIVPKSKRLAHSDAKSTPARLPGDPRDPNIPRTAYCLRALDYAKSVISGSIPACRQVKLACKRQLDDLSRCTKPDPNGPQIWESKQPKWEWQFSEYHANRVCDFIERLPHIKGRWSTRNVLLEDWQCFIVTTTFGWLHRDTLLRRFIKALILLPRKQGKSFLAAAIGLYLLTSDSEPGAEVVSAAVTRDQAKIVWKVAREMCVRSHDLCEEFGIQPLAHLITIPQNAATFTPLSRDSRALEGLNPHGAIIDELHAHKTREVYDVLDQATGARSEPLLFIISTAGDNKVGVCYEQVDLLRNIHEGRHKDERFFGVEYTIDSTDDPFSLQAAIKANPNYGISVQPDKLEAARLAATRSAAAQNTYLTKRLNVWVSAGTAYFNMLSWQNKCRVTRNRLLIEDFYEQPCYISLDLASKVDIAAKIMLFRDENRIRYVFGKYYLPEAALEKGNPNYDFYIGWYKQGLIDVTDGDMIDFEHIEDDLLQDRNQFSVKAVAYDPFQADELSMRMLKEGLPMIKIVPSVKNYSESMKLIDGLIRGGNIKHNGDPVLEWMMGNVTAHKDFKQNVYPRQARDESKIDGAVALIAAGRLDLAMMGEDEEIYQDRGLRTL